MEYINSKKNDTDWTKKGYKHIIDFDDVVSFWKCFYHIDWEHDDFDFYIFEKGHWPCWEDYDHGGIYTINLVNKKEMYSVWERLAIHLIGEITYQKNIQDEKNQDKDDNNSNDDNIQQEIKNNYIFGIALLSKKKHFFCIIQIWVKNNNNNTNIKQKDYYDYNHKKNLSQFIKMIKEDDSNFDFKKIFFESFETKKNKENQHLCS